MFDKIYKFFGMLGLEITFLIGLIGGIINYQSIKHLPLLKKATVLLGGGFAANYGTPLVMDFFSFSPERAFGIAFFVGYIGLKGLENILHERRFIVKKDENYSKDNDAEL